MDRRCQDGARHRCYYCSRWKQGKLQNSAIRTSQRTGFYEFLQTYAALEGPFGFLKCRILGFVGSSTQGQALDQLVLRLELPWMAPSSTSGSTELLTCHGKLLNPRTYFRTSKYLRTTQVIIFGRNQSLFNKLCILSGIDDCKKLLMPVKRN